MTCYWHALEIFGTSEVGIYKRKQVWNKKPRSWPRKRPIKQEKKERKQELDQESDQENKKKKKENKNSTKKVIKRTIKKERKQELDQEKKNFLFFLISFLVEFLFSCLFFINSHLCLTVIRRTSMSGITVECPPCVGQTSHNFCWPVCSSSSNISSLFLARLFQSASSREAAYAFCGFSKQMAALAISWRKFQKKNTASCPWNLFLNMDYWTNNDFVKPWTV